MRKVEIWRGNELRGHCMLGDDGGYTLHTEDEELEKALEILALRPVGQMEVGDDWQIYEPGSLGHSKVMLTGGELVRYGYVGTFA